MKTAVHQYEDKLLEFAYGELPAPEASAIEAHVRSCAKCSQALSEIRAVRSTMSALPPVAAPAAGLESLLQYAEQAAARNKAAASPARSWRRFLAPLASAMALVVVGVVAWRASQEFDPDPAMVALKQQRADAESSRKNEPAPALAPPAGLAEKPKDAPAATPPNDFAGSGDGTPADKAANEWEEQQAKPQERLADSKEGALGGEASALDALGSTREPKRKAKPTPTQKPAPEPRQSLARREVTKAPAEPPEALALRDDFSNAAQRGANLKQPPAKPAAPNADPALSFGLGTGSSLGGLGTGGAQQAGGRGGGTSSPPAPQAAQPKVAEAKPEQERTRTAAVSGKKDAAPAREEPAPDVWAQSPSAAPASVSPPPPPAPRPVVAAPAPTSAPPQKGSYGLRGLSSGPSVASTRGAEDDESAMAERLDAQGVDADAKFAERQRAASRQKSLEAARVASNRGDRLGEVKLALEVLQAGATGYEKVEALKRLCDAYEALGEEDAAHPYCDQLQREFPNTAAARAVADRHNRLQRAPMPAAKKAAPSERKAADDASDKAEQKPAEAAPAQAY